MWLLRLLHVTFSVEAFSALLLSWGSPLWKRSLGIAELCWSLQKQDAFSPEVCGSQLPNEAYLIKKELVPIEKKKESACNVGDLGSIPGLGRCPGEGKGYPLQYSGLENSMDCMVHGVPKSWTWLSDFQVYISIHQCRRHKYNPWGRSLGGGNYNPLQYSCLENPMDREEPGGLQSTKLQTRTQLSNWAQSSRSH